MIFFVLSCILLFLFALFDNKYTDHIQWYLVTLIFVLVLSGCSSIPPSPYDNEPFIWID